MIGCVFRERHVRSFPKNQSRYRIQTKSSSGADVGRFRQNMTDQLTLFRFRPIVWRYPVFRTPPYIEI